MAQGSRPAPMRKEIKAIRTIEGGPQGRLVQLGDIHDRPRPNAIGKTKQRAAMRHPGKSKATFTVSLDWRRTRQVWSIGAAADCHLLLPLRGSQSVTAGADAKVNQYRRSNKHRCISADEHDAKHHRRREAMDRLPTEQQEG